MALQVACACGWTASGEHDALLDAVREHCAHHHQVTPAVEEIMAVATPVPDAEDGE